MGKLVSWVFVLGNLVVVVIFMAIAYDMEVLSTGGLNTFVLGERIDGTHVLVEYVLPDDASGLVYQPTRPVVVDQITVTLCGYESYLGANLNRWLRRRIDPETESTGLYRKRDSARTLIIH